MALSSVVGYVSHFKTGWFLQNLNQNINFKCIHLRKWKHFANKSIFRQMGHESKTQQKSETVAPFLEMVNSRRAEAKKSILVQVQSAQSFKELYSYCNTIGTVNSMFHYTASAEQSHFIIVEFAEQSYVDDILNNGSHLDNSPAVPVHSNFLWFRASGRRAPKLKEVKKLNVENGNRIATDDEVTDILQSCESISDQIMALYNITNLNDVATRLRFLTARQIELALSGMFPKAVAYPFGSSVNGFGKMGCDLDVVLRLSDESTVAEENRLVFHCKALNGYEKLTSQRYMEVVGDVLQLFLPGCSQIRKILQARVPIIKYYHQLTDVECDLSMSNMSGVCMSDLLYIYGSIDYRVRPLVFTIRKWAQQVGLTNSSPGRWITNFSLTLLVLAFLQRPGQTPPILPSFNSLIKLAGVNDKYITEDGVNCTFLRDITKLNCKTKNTDNLETLLKEFYEYYSSFDFSAKAICLNEAIMITKPEHSALYIVNPLERGLNVSKNISYEELEKFKLELRNAAWTLESQEKKSGNWGILDIFENKKRKFASSHSMFRQSRLMEVSKLFKDDVDEKQTDVIYKNQNIKKEIEKIKNNTEKQINEIRSNSRSNIRQKSRR